MNRETAVSKLTGNERLIVFKYLSYMQDHFIESVSKW